MQAAEYTQPMPSSSSPSREPPTPPAPPGPATSPGTNAGRSLTFMDFIESMLLKAMLFGVIVLALVLGTAWYFGGLTRPAPPPSTAAQSASPVSLVVDFGDGAQMRFLNLAYSPQMTVLDVLKAAKSHPRALQFTTRGEGPMTLLVSVAGVENAGKDGGNWQFWINQAYGTTSIAVAAIQPGDRVTLGFAKYESLKTPPQ